MKSSSVLFSAEFESSSLFAEFYLPMSTDENELNGEILFADAKGEESP